MGQGVKQAFVSGLTEITTVPKDQLGDLRWEGSKAYKYVKFVQGTLVVAVVAGDVSYYKSYSASECMSDLTDIEANLAAGIMQAAWDGTTTSYGWLLIKGYTSITDVVAGAAGAQLTTIGATDKKLDVTALLTDPIFAHLLDATASAMIAIADFPF